MSFRTSLCSLVALYLLSAAPASSAVAGLHATMKGVRNAKGRGGCLVGMPTEGYGASRGARGTFGPKYEDASFGYRGGSLAMPVTLKY